MVRLARGLMASAVLAAAAWLVLMQLQPSTALAQAECIDDCNTPPPLQRAVGPPTVTGADNSGGSIGGLDNQRFNQMITNRVLGTVLLGVNEQVNCSDCISAFGSAGSFSAGIHGRKEIKIGRASCRERVVM